MKKRILLSLMIIFSIYVNGWAQSVACTGGTGDKTYSFSELSSNIINSNNYTGITVTGDWNKASMITLFSAMGPGNTILRTIDMSAAKLTEGVFFMGNFSGYTKLTSIIFPNTVCDKETQFDYLFMNCSRLKTITNLDKFTNVSSFYNTFAGTTALTEVTFPKFIPGVSLGGAFDQANPNCIKYVVDEADKKTAETARWTNVQIKDATNVENISATDGLIFSTSADSKLVIESSMARTISIFNVSGQEINKVSISEGANTIDNLEKGIYIVEGTKVIL
ncbi:MAG: hypothetical protein RR319_03170 [Bacteroides sp.]